MKLNRVMCAAASVALLSVSGAYAKPVAPGGSDPVLDPCQTTSVVISTDCVGAFLQSTGQPTASELNAALLGGYDDWSRVDAIDGDKPTSVFFTITGIDAKSGTWEILNPEPGKMYALSLKGSTQWAAYLLSGFSGTWFTTDLNTPSGNQPDLSNAVLFHRVGEPGVVPLPAAGWLLLAGVGGLAAMRRKKSA